MQVNAFFVSYHIYKVCATKKARPSAPQLPGGNGFSYKLGFDGEGDERECSFLEPKKEPKKAAFVAVNVAGFSANRL